MTKATSARLLVALPMLLGCLFLVAGPAFAQSASSTFSVKVSGTLSPTASSTPTTTSPGESITCTGTVKVMSTAVSDPTLPPQVVVSVDTTAVTCTGQTSKTVYLNSGQGNLTRPLVANDKIDMTFAVYPNVAGGYMKARTGLATVNLSFDTTTGALTGASAALTSFSN